MTKTKSYLLSTALVASLGLNGVMINNAVSEVDASPIPVNDEGYSDLGAVACETVWSIAEQRACAEVSANPDVASCAAGDFIEVRVERQPVGCRLRAEGIFPGVAKVVE